MQYKKNDENIDLEGYYIQIDLQNSSNQNLFRKHVYEVIANDVVIMNLSEYKFDVLEIDEESLVEKEKRRKEYQKHELDMLSSDLRFISGVGQANYDDKLLQKNQPRPAGPQNGLKSIIVSYNQADFSAPLSYLVKSLQQNFSDFSVSTSFGQTVKDEVKSEVSKKEYLKKNTIFVCQSADFERCFAYVSQQFQFLATVQLGDQQIVNAMTESCEFQPFSAATQAQSLVLQKAFYRTQTGSFEQLLPDTERIDEEVKKLQFKPISEFFVFQKNEKEVKTEVCENAFQIKLQNKPNLKQIVGILMETQFMKHFATKNAKVCFKFDRFIVEFQGKVFSVCVDSFKESDTLKVSTKEWFAELNGLSQQFVLMMQDEFSKQLIYENKVKEYIQQEEEKEMNEFIKKQPLPEGWFQDCGRFMDWNGNIAENRPDYEELVKKFKAGK